MVLKTLKVKKLNLNGRLPTKNNASDAGYDLYCAEDYRIKAGQTAKIKTAIALKIPDGYYGQIQSRSGLASKGIVAKGGVIDSGYTGEILILLNNNGDYEHYISRGERVAQLILHQVPNFTVKEVEELEETERSNKGFGSSGK